MNIQNICKEKGEVTVTLSADDLIVISNAMYHQSSENKNNKKFQKLRSDIMIARDLCQYGHIDDFTMSCIIECRDITDNILSKEETI